MKKTIVVDPKILGGKPVIVGTRIPVEQVLFLLKQGFTIEAIHEFYPQVGIETLENTIDEAVQLINENASQVL